MMVRVFICLQILTSSIVEMASDGAKQSACASMYPGHFAREQNGKCPYVLTVSSSTYHPLANISVTVKSNDLVGMKGFLCQARQKLEEYITFGSLTPTGDFKMENNCDQKASLTHADASIKQYINFVWTAPEFDAGGISIICTIVQHFDKFWINVTSPEIKFSHTVTDSVSHDTSSKYPLTTPSTSSTTTVRQTSLTGTNSTGSPTSNQSKTESSVISTSKTSIQGKSSVTEATTTEMFTSSGNKLILSAFFPFIFCFTAVVFAT